MDRVKALLCRRWREPFERARHRPHENVDHVPVMQVDERRDGALDHARSYLRHELGIRLELFKTPELHFEADMSAELGDRWQNILKRVRKGRPRA